MLKSCKYCGRIHDSKYNCGKKPTYKRVKQQDTFRNTKEWQNKREEIKERDLYLCAVCKRKLYNTIDQFNYTDVSVHHAVPINQDYDKRLDNDNLLTLCDYHHELAEKGEIPLKVILDIINEQSNTPPTIEG